MIVKEIGAWMCAFVWAVCVAAILIITVILNIVFFQISPSERCRRRTADLPGATS